jgi:lysophospholipase L1-like esterase
MRHSLRPLRVLLAALALPAGLATGLTAAEPTRVTIDNGAMSEGAALPSGWDQHWTGSGAPVISRDTTVFHSAPAALKITSGDQPAKGNAFRWVDCTGGVTVRLAGALKVDGAATASVFVQSFSAEWKPIGYVQLTVRSGSDGADWATWEGAADIPAEAVRFAVGVAIDGTGTAWLDDVRDAKDAAPGAAAAPVAAAPVAAAPAPATGNSTEVASTDHAPAKASPSTPGWGFWPKFPADWQRTFDGQLKRTKQGNIDVVFLGDSITQGWGGSGKALWEANFAPLKAVNYGIGGDSTRQALWRLEHGLVDGLTPKLLVLAIGTNNLYGDYNGGTDDEIAAGIRHTVDVVRAKLPQTKVLVLAMLPRQNSYFCDRITRINALVAASLAASADTAQVRFLDPGAAFTTAPGTVKADYYVADQVHLTPAGYVAYQAAIGPVVKELAK